MEYLDLTPDDLEQEMDRIIAFIQEQVGPTASVVIGLSGGIDSDCTARLCARAIGVDRMKCFTVLQDDFEQKYITNACALSADLGCDLVKLPLAPFPKQLIAAIAEADPDVGFRPEGLLDVARSKCALRTFVFSAYTERGYLVAGPSNRTEIELGYYLPFGDGLSHFSPIAHLYKTEVQQLAQAVGTQQAVVAQQPAAGFWKGDSDLEGIAYWLYNEGPIQVELDLDETQEQIVADIQRELSFRAIDTTLILLGEGHSTDHIAQVSGLSPRSVERLATLRHRSSQTKNRALSARLPRKAAGVSAPA